MAQPHPAVSGTKVVGHRKGNRGPCRRCGLEIEFRSDRPQRLCRDCVAVEPGWNNRKA